MKRVLFFYKIDYLLMDKYQLDKSITQKFYSEHRIYTATMYIS